MLGHIASLMHSHCVPSSSPSLDLVYLDYGCFEEGTLLLPVLGCQHPNLQCFFRHVP